MRAEKICIAMACMILAAAAAGCSKAEEQPSPYLKGEVISNLQMVSYIKINSDIIGYVQNEIRAVIHSSAELDFVNDKVHIQSSMNADGSETVMDYYRNRNVIFQNRNGTWEIIGTEKLESQKGLVSLIERLGNVEKVVNIGSETVQGADAYVLRSEISEEDSLELIDELFHDTITGGSGAYVFRKGSTLWWIDKERKIVLMETRTVEAEIDRIPIKAMLKTSYKDYDQPFSIRTPMIINANSTGQAS